jgi:4-amino-4-deoxy-L-arabinose transferase-like glycosyltransferase
MFVGGVNVASPIIGENLVFVSLLALGVYQCGRLLFGRLAGMLAVVFALGSPLLTSLFHVFMLDAPLTSMVAVTIWLILASEDFSRPGVSAWAGLAAGLGMSVKSQFAQFVLGLIVVVLLHGGWRNWRGLLSFSVVALVIGGPWYFVHFSELGTLLNVAGTSVGAPPGNVPPTLSLDNFSWYFWNVLNSQLLAPLFMLALGGTIWTLVEVVRSRDEHGARMELLAGAFLAWLVVTLTPHHDIRYGLELLAYLAIIATGWIASLPRAARLVAIAVLVIGALANTLGVTFGVGKEVRIALAHPLVETEQYPGRIVLYSTTGFLAASPDRDGDVPGLLEALRREGVRTVTWGFNQSRQPDFSFEGVAPLARIAKLTPELTASPELAASASVATLIHEAVTANTPPTCTRVNDRNNTSSSGEGSGTGIWVARYDAAAHKLALYCPSHRPQYYDIGAAL